MSHINGDISRTSLSQAVQHLDNVNTHHNPTNTTRQEAGCNVTSLPNNGSASTHVNLHYSLVPSTSRPQNTHHNIPTSFERKAIFRPNSHTFRPTFHPANLPRKKLAMWQHDFLCLSYTTDNRAPSDMDKGTKLN